MGFSDKDTCRFERLCAFLGCNNTHCPAGCALALRRASLLAHMTSVKSRTSLRVSSTCNPPHDSPKEKIVESDSFQLQSRALSPHCQYTTGRCMVTFFSTDASEETKVTQIKRQNVKDIF